MGSFFSRSGNVFGRLSIVEGIVTILLAYFQQVLSLEGRFKHTYDVESISALPRDQVQYIKAIGPAKCLHGSPYSFEVFPGDTDKVLVFFQGGGLCWNQMSIDRHHCPAQFVPLKPAGLLERGVDSKSKFKSYTLVVVSYCSGDVGIGASSSVSYKGPKGEKIFHMGAMNTMAVIDWIALQQSQATLSPVLEALVVLGASAGSTGALMWSPHILNTINWKTSVVFLDSMVYTFPPGYFADFIRAFRSCEFLRRTISESLAHRCGDKTFAVSEVFAIALSLNPDVPYVLLQSKKDESIRGNFNNVGFNGHYIKKMVTLDYLYDRLNSELIAVNQRSPNLLVYLVDGTSHVFTNRDNYFDADAAGVSDEFTIHQRSHSPTQPALKEYLESFPLSPGKTAASVCHGEEITELQERLIDDEKFNSNIAGKRRLTTSTISNNSRNGSSKNNQSSSINNSKSNNSSSSNSSGRNARTLRTGDKVVNMLDGAGDGKYCLRSLTHKTFTQTAHTVSETA